MYNAYIVKIKNIQPHPNADRLNIGECFGNSVIIDKNYTEDKLYLYFPTDGQLSLEYCQHNNLLRKLDENGVNIGGYLDPDKRNIKAINLRGSKSDGLVMPLSSIAFTGANLDDYNVGDTITVVNGIEICGKYIPRGRNRDNSGTAPGLHKSKIDIAPLFTEHKDTEQLAYNLDAFKPGDEIEITLKMHGTSQRTAYLPVLKGYKRTLWDRITRKEGIPIYDYDYVSGTRRTILNDYEGGFYGSNKFRQQHHDQFVDKLMKGETVYYEVVGFTDTGVSIMGKCNNAKLGKDFIKQYGNETVFSYGCEPHPVIHEGYNDSTYGYQNERIEYKLPQSDIYVYRMTMTNEDGFTVEYTPDFMRYRCEQMGVKCVPVFYKGFLPKQPYGEPTEEQREMGYLSSGPISHGEYVKNIAEQFYDGPDPVGKTHIREGVVVRIVNRPTFKAYKHKNFEFKMLEGLIKDTADAPDMEEAEELIKEN